MKLAIAVVVILLSTIGTKCDLESGWKGIRVFETTRTEVERILGSPTESDDVEARYESKEAIVSVLYSAEPCSAPKTLTGGFKVRQDTVLEYDVVPKGDLRLDALDWNRNLYERYPDPHVLNMVGYYNRRDGIRISTSANGPQKTEFVTSIYFERTPEQESRFKCEPVK